MNRQSGMSLVEVMIATTILVIVVGLAYPGFKTAGDTMATSGRQDRMERHGDRALRLLTREVRSGWITDQSPPDTAPSLTIRCLRGNVELSDLAGRGAVPWATGEKVIRFRQIAVLVEANEKTDLNCDGDRNDRFALGVLESVETVNGEDVVARLTGTSSRVILALPSFAGDLNGDGVGDPLFVVNNRILDISIRLVNRMKNGRLLQTVARSRIRLRNPQE